MSYVHAANSGWKLSGLVVVTVFHVAIIYALVNGLARKIVEVVSKPIETKIIEEVKPPPPEKPPPPPPPRLTAPPPPYIPPPEVQVQLPQTPAPAISAVTTVRPAEPVAAPGQRAPVVAAPVQLQRAPVRTPPVVDAGACDRPQYPPASIRAQETGIVALGFLIDVDGKVIESKVERSSGFRRLDEAARNALGLCKFKTATVDGKPERAWARIEYEWKIE